METIFSIPTNRSASDGTGVSRANSGNSNSSSKADSISTHLLTNKFTTRPLPLDSIMITPSDETHNHHLHHNHLHNHHHHTLSPLLSDHHHHHSVNLPSIKPISGASPLLVDDEDDDMRSLLAAAAAVAASVSPPSPSQLHSSCSGLNTPPDAPSCHQPLTNILGEDCGENDAIKSERGLHMSGGAALLVRRLNCALSNLDEREDETDKPHSPHTAPITSTLTDSTNNTFSSYFPLISTPNSECDKPLISVPCSSSFQTHHLSPLPSSTVPVDSPSVGAPQSHSNSNHVPTKVDNDSPLPSTSDPMSEFNLPYSNHEDFDTKPLSPHLGHSPLSVTQRDPNTPIRTPEPLGTAENQSGCCGNLDPIFDHQESLTPTKMVVKLDTMSTVETESPRCVQPLHHSPKSISTKNVGKEETEETSTAIVTDTLCDPIKTETSPAISTDPNIIDKSPDLCETTLPVATCVSEIPISHSSMKSERESQASVKPSLSMEDTVIESSDAPATVVLPSPKSVESNNDDKTDMSDSDFVEEPAYITSDLIKVESSTYDEADYVSAAVKAVESVVSELAGYRSPDTTQPPDPCLEGTGTDRIYTLSLAPPVVSQSSGVVCPISSTIDLVGDRSASSTSSPPPTITTTTALSITNLVDLRSISNHPYPHSSSASAVMTNGGPIPITPRTTCSDSSIVKWDSDGMKSSFIPISSPMTEHDGQSMPALQQQQFPCHACDRVFAQKALLFKHRIMHEEPKHACETCGKCFVREDKLKRHVLSIHSAEKPHICDICGKAFSRKDKLKDHLKHHERAARNFECIQCQQRFVQKSDLNRHVRGVHEGEPGVGINMGTKRRANAGSTPITKVSRKKTKANSLDTMSYILSSDPGSAISTSTTTTSSTPIIGDSLKKDCSDQSVDLNLISTTATSSATTMPTTFLPTNPILATGGGAGMFLSANLTPAQQHLLHQQQQAAAAAAVMLPGGLAQQQSLALHQQQQQQLFAINAMPGQTAMYHPQQQTTANPTDLKAVAAQSGPMMVLTRLAAANQSGQIHQLHGHAVFPQMMGFHPATAQQQLQQWQQHAAVVQQQQQLLQQHHATYGAAAAHQFQLQQQAAATQLQQQQHQQAAAAAALAARQQVAQSFLFHPSVSTATGGGGPTNFFCNPQDASLTAGLILASSADPTSLALAAAAAQAQAAAQVAAANPSVTYTTPLSASTLAGLQVVAGYNPADISQNNQQLLLQQQQQYRQRLAVVAAAATATVSSNSTSTTTPTVSDGGGSTTALPNGAGPAAVVQLTNQDQMRQQQQILTAQPDSSVAMNNCYQLAAALYQQHHRHPGFMLAPPNGPHSAMAAMALQQQQYQQHQAAQQQQQADLMAAYQQQQSQQAAVQHQVTQQQQQQQQNQLVQQTPLSISK